MFDGVVKSPICGVVVFFRRSAYYVYSLAPEKTRRLVYGPFYLTISVTFYKLINDWQ